MPLPAFTTMRLARLPAPFDHRDWIFELKYGGFRADLDGEIVHLGCDAKPHFFSLMRRFREQIPVCSGFATVDLVMATFLLIHGAWHGGWCWRNIVPPLEAKGHTVITPDLPGHGDVTPPATVTLKHYTETICRIARARPEPVILLGHSMGGLAITQAAEDCPGQVRALVYMCAFLPRRGDSLMTWAQQDSGSIVNANIVPLAHGVFGLKPEVLHEAFFENCTEEDEAFARSRLVPQPAEPFGVPVETTTDRWGRIPRYYIECNRDRAITLKLQREMQKHSPCQKTFSIDTGHSPFFSAPERLTDILLQIGSL